MTIQKLFDHRGGLTAEGECPDCGEEMFYSLAANGEGYVCDTCDQYEQEQDEERDEER